MPDHRGLTTEASVTRATGTGINRMALHPPGLTIRRDRPSLAPAPLGDLPVPAVF